MDICPPALLTILLLMLAAAVAFVVSLAILGIDGIYRNSWISGKIQALVRTYSG